MRSRWRANGEGERRRSPTGSPWRLCHGVAKDPQRSGGRRRRTFLIFRARNGGLLSGRQGKKVRRRRCVTGDRGVSRPSPRSAKSRLPQSGTNMTAPMMATENSPCRRNDGTGLRRPVRRQAADVRQRRKMPEIARNAGSREVSGATAVHSTAIEAARGIG